MIESYLDDVEEPMRSRLFQQLLLVERSTRKQMGEETLSDGYLRRFPHYRALIEEVDDDFQVSADRTHDFSEGEVVGGDHSNGIVVYEFFQYGCGADAPVMTVRTMHQFIKQEKNGSVTIQKQGDITQAGHLCIEM